MRDRWSYYRETLDEALKQAVTEDGFSSTQLVREQLGAAEPADWEGAAIACLAAAEAAGGATESALPGATALALVAQMGLVFASLGNARGAASLSTAWGMPRSLNAGDALFALAQEVILTAPNELTAGGRLQAVALLDGAGRAVAEALLDAGPDSSPASTILRALLPPAMAMGGLLGRVSSDSRERLEALARRWSALGDEELATAIRGDPKAWLAS